MVRYSKEELADILLSFGKAVSNKTLKRELEEEIFQYLIDHPRALETNPNLEDYIKERRSPASSRGQGLTPKAEDTTAADVIPQALPEADINAAESEPVGSIANHVNTTVASLETSADVRSKAVLGISRSVLDHLELGWVSFQNKISKVAAINWIILTVEYVLTVFSYWPRSLMGQALYEWPDLQPAVIMLLKNVAFTVVPAIILSALIDPRKNASVGKKHRRKSGYRLDPVIFGLSRLVSASFLMFFFTHVLTNPQVPAITGLTSALLGIYTSILQT